jgi:hypothetical protein
MLTHKICFTNSAITRAVHCMYSTILPELYIQHSSTVIDSTYVVLLLPTPRVQYIKRLLVQLVRHFLALAIFWTYCPEGASWAKLDNLHTYVCVHRVPTYRNAGATNYYQHVQYSPFCKSKSYFLSNKVHRYWKIKWSWGSRGTNLNLEANQLYLLLQFYGSTGSAPYVHHRLYCTTHNTLIYIHVVHGSVVRRRVRDARHQQLEHRGTVAHCTTVVLYK